MSIRDCPDDACSMDDAEDGGDFDADALLALLEVDGDAVGSLATGLEAERDPSDGSAEAEDRAMRRKANDAAFARRYRARKKGELWELQTQVASLGTQLEALRARTETASCFGLTASWEQRAVALRRKRRHAERVNAQLKRAFVQQRSFLRNLKTVFSSSPMLAPEFNMRCLLHTYTRLGRSACSRSRDYQALRTDDKLDLAMQTLATETEAIPFVTPSFTAHPVQVQEGEFGMTAVSVYALDTVDMDKIFGAACRAYLSCRIIWPNYTLTWAKASVVDSPAENIQYCVSDVRYKNDATGEEIRTESRLISYYRVTDEYAVLLWDFADADDLYPLKKETHMKCDTTGAILVRQELCDDGVMRVVCRAICTKVHTFNAVETSQNIVGFSQQKELGAKVGSSWIYEQINSSLEQCC